jgi:hypothetical protein
MAFLDKVTEGVGILGGVAGRKALVGHVEEGEEGAFLCEVAFLLISMLIR